VVHRRRSFLASALLAGLFAVTAPGPSGSQPAGERLLTDFSEDAPDLGWYVVNDGVMGGRSEGGFEIVDGELLFTGKTNTRGGGFSSIRTGPLELDLGDYQGIRVKVLGDGRRYTWRLATPATWRGTTIGYWAEFDTENGEWLVVDVPFRDFVPQVRGQRLDGPPLDLSRITGMGLMIYDGRDGAFELRLDEVHAYR